MLSRHNADIYIILYSFNNYMLPNNAEQRISQRDILRRSPVALSDIIPQQKRAHPAGGFLSYRKVISYTIKKVSQ